MADETSSNGNGSKKMISMSEVEKHDSEDDCWIVVEGKVYNVSKFLDEHPGGPGVITEVAGTDATEPYVHIHSYTHMTHVLSLSMCGTVRMRSSLSLAVAARSVTHTNVDIHHKNMSYTYARECFRFEDIGHTQKAQDDLASHYIGDLEGYVAKKVDEAKQSSESGGSTSLILILGAVVAVGAVAYTQFM